MKVQSVVLDGEIVCLNEAGKPEFHDLVFRRGELRLVAFDLLCCAPLSERKHKLRSVPCEDSDRFLYRDHIENDGLSLFLACENDLEGIVAK